MVKNAKVENPPLELKKCWFRVPTVVLDLKRCYSSSFIKIGSKTQIPKEKLSTVFRFGVPFETSPNDYMSRNKFETSPNDYVSPISSCNHKIP